MNCLWGSIICPRRENCLRSIDTQRTRRGHTTNPPTLPPTPRPLPQKCLDTLCFRPSLSPCDGVDPSTWRCSRPSIVIGIKARDWSEEVTVLQKKQQSRDRQIRKTRAHGTGYYLVFPALTMEYIIGKEKSQRSKTNGGGGAEALKCHEAI